MQNALYMTDSYLKEFEATVESVKDDKFVVLSQTAFYPKGGGQEHDTGALLCNGEEYPVVFAGKFDGKISHEVSKPGLKIGDKVTGKIDWDRRYRHMRMHTAAHIIDAILYNESGALCTGNQLGMEKSRIDFSLDVLDRDKIQQYVDIGCNGLSINVFSIEYHQIQIIIPAYNTSFYYSFPCSQQKPKKSCLSQKCS